MNYHTSVEIAFSAYSAEIPVVVEYDIHGYDLIIKTIRLEHSAHEWFQPAIDSINEKLDYEHLILVIRSDLLERKKEEIAASHFDDLNGGDL